MNGVGTIGSHEVPGTVVVVASQFPEPNETFIVRELAELQRRGVEVRIFSLRPPPRRMPPEAEALLPLVVYPPRGIGMLLAEALRFVERDPLAALRGLARGLLDIVAALPTPPLALKQAFLLPLALAYAARLSRGSCRLHAHFANVPTAVIRILAAIRGSRYGFTAHAWDIYVPEHRRQLPARFADADLVVTCTAHNRRFLRSLARTPLDADKVVLCHHGLDLPAYAPSEERDPRLVVGGASLVEKKGLRDLVAACARLRDRGLDVRCVLIGEGPERRALEAQIDRLGLGDRVRLAGWLPHRQVIAHLSRAAVFAHPSIVDRRGSMDGIPNTILEAMALATPVVASRLSGIPEVVIPEETGLLVAPGDAAGLAEALARVLGDVALAQRLGAAGRELVLARFDVRTNVGRLARLLASAAAEERLWAAAATERAALVFRGGTQRRPWRLSIYPQPLGIPVAEIVS